MNVAKGFLHPDFGSKRPTLGNSYPQSGNLHTEKGSDESINGKINPDFRKKRKPKRKTANAQKKQH